VWGTLLFLIPLAVLLLPVLLGVAAPRVSRAALDVEVDALPAAVWRVLMKPETSGAIIERVGEDAWIEDLGIARIRVRTLEARENERLVRELEDASIPMRARWTVELTAVDGRTRIRASNETEVARGTWRAPLVRFLMRFMSGPRRALVHYFRRLGGALGVEVHIDDAPVSA
jgi:hypothetical protein